MDRPKRDGPHKRHPRERAVLRYAQRPAAGLDGASNANRKALLWIPGRNDSFFHVHLLPELVDELGYDVFALDLRRCGEATVAEGGGGEPAVSDRLLAHDSHDFEEYFEELDETLRFLSDPSPPSEGDVGSGLLRVQGGGCGRAYDAVVSWLVFLHIDDKAALRAPQRSHPSLSSLKHSMTVSSQHPCMHTGQRHYRAH